uniref:ZnMc domain-containing protein n=1 Tax=Haemonchus contortus TaxID=6289 RepID=A0A7I4YD45_HAECO
MSQRLAMAILCSALGVCIALDEIEYLRQFGYLTTRGAESQLTAEAISSALKRFQRMFGIPQTGIMDQRTAELMAKPRCGVKDEPTMRFRQRRSLPYPRWKMNKFTFLVTTWSRRLSAGAVDAVLSKAFKEWEKHADLDFRRAHDPVLDIKFGVGSHHCEYPFTTQVLAHAFRPRSVEFEPNEDPSRLIGDIHFNDDVPWAPDLLFATAIHEIGHALGLPHVGDVNSIMYPILVEGQQFTREDIYTIQSLYGPPPRKERDNERLVVSRHETDGNLDREASQRSPQDTDRQKDVRPHPCASEADAITTFRGEFIVFKDKWLWRVISNGREIYGPHLISNVFPDLPEKIDAAVEIRGEIWIFSGNRYWIYSERRLRSGPQPLSSLGLPENLQRIRLAYQWHYFKPPATYLWAERDYWKLDVNSRRVERSYARRISLNWKHVPQNATAAFSRDKELYFMQGDLVYKMNTTDYRLPVATGYPVPISKYWPFCRRQNESMHFAAKQTNSATCISIAVVLFGAFLTFSS